MKKKLLILPLLLVCLFAGIFIGSCGKTSTNVDANSNSFRKIDSNGEHNMYVWTDPEQDCDYIIYHNEWKGSWNICPRVMKEN